jgi:hypothetical protein
MFVMQTFTTWLGHIYHESWPPRCGLTALIASSSGWRLQPEDVIAVLKTPNALERAAKHFTAFQFS